MKYRLLLFHRFVILVHLALLVWGLAEKFGRVSVRNVDHDSVRVSQFHLFVNQVWKLAEWQVKRVFDRRPFLDR